MTTHPDPSAFTRDQYPERTLIQGLLLSAHNMIVRRGMLNEASRTACANLYDSIVPLLDPIRVVAAVGYGMPAWLVDSVLDDLTSDVAGSLGKELPADLVGFLLTALWPLSERPPDPPIEQLSDVLRLTLLRAASASSSLNWLRQRPLSMDASDAVVEREVRHRILCRDLLVVIGDQHSTGLSLRIDWCGGPDDALDNPKCRVSVPNQELIGGLWSESSVRDGATEKPDMIGKWEPAARDFTSGLQSGCIAAVKLLMELGARRESLHRFARGDVTLYGVLPACQLDERSGGLVVALDVLAQHADLAHPARIASTGALSGDGTLSLSRASDVRLKRDALLTDGVRHELLAWHDLDGGEFTGVRRPATGTLEAAAAAYWGRSWAEWVDNQLRAELLALGLDLGWNPSPFEAAVTIGETRVNVDVPMVDAVVQALTSSAIPILYQIVGRARSGKTWIAARAAEQLSRGGKWRTHVLVSRHPTQVMPEQLQKAIHLVARAKEAGTRVIVFIDNLQWTTALEELEETLQNAVEDLGVYVVPITRQDAGTQWKWTCSATTAITSEASLRDLLRRAIAQLSPRLDDRAGFVDHLVADQTVGKDVWLALNLLVCASGEMSEIGNLVDEFVIGRLGALHDDQWRVVQHLAAYSLLELPWPDRKQELTDGLCQMLTGRFALRHTEHGWLVPSLLVCKALLSLELHEGQFVVSDTPVEREVVAHLFPRGQSLPASFPSLLFRIRHRREEFLTEIARQRGQFIVDWCHTTQAPELIADVVVLIGRYLRQNELAAAMDALAATTLQRLKESTPTRAIAEHALTRCLSALNRHQELAFPRLSGDQTPDFAGVERWAEFLRFLRPAALHTIKNEESIIHRARLLKSLTGVDPSLFFAVQDCLPDAIAGPKTAAEYRTIVELLRSPMMLGSAKGGASTHFSRLVNDVERLRVDDFEAYCCQIALRLALKEENRPYHDVAKQMAGIARRNPDTATLTKIKRAIHVLARAAPSSAVQLLEKLRANPDTMQFLRDRCRRSSPAQCASLIKTLLDAHAGLALSLTYTRSPSGELFVDKQFVRDMVQQMKKPQHAKGAGLLLRVTGQMDMAFGDVSQGVATSLAAELGPSWFSGLLSDLEPRFSIIRHLVEALVYCHAPFVEDFIEQIVDRLVPVLSRSRRPAAVLLAIHLVKHSDRFPTVIERLRSQLGEATVADLMRKAGDEITLASAHELAALYPNAVLDFGREEPHTIMRIIKRLSNVGSPNIKAQSFRAIETTLRRARGPAGSKEATAHEERGWGTAMRRAASPGELTGAIEILTRLDRRECTRALHESYGTLEFWLRYAMEGPQQAVDLLASVDRVLPELAKKLLADVPISRREQFEDDLAHIQQPRLMANCYRRLARIGFVPEPRVQGLILRRWQASAQQLAAPGSIADLLQMFLSWNPELADEFERDVRLDRVGARIARGALVDLRAAAELAGVLYALGLESKARDLIERIPLKQIVARRVSIGDMAHIFRMIAPVHPELLAGLAAESRYRVTTAIAESCPLDDLHFWLDIGWLCHFAGEAGKPIVVEVDPLSWSFWRPPDLDIWALAWLHPNDWSRNRLNAAIGRWRKGESSASFKPVLFACAAPRLGLPEPLAAVHSTAIQGSSPAAVALLHKSIPEVPSELIEPIRCVLDKVRYRGDPWRRWLLDHDPRFNIARHS